MWGPPRDIRGRPFSRSPRPPAFRLWPASGNEALIVAAPDADEDSTDWAEDTV